MTPTPPKPSSPALVQTNVRANKNRTNVRVPAAIRFAGRLAAALHPTVAARLLLALFTFPRRRARPAREQRALLRATPFRLPLPSGERLWAWGWGTGPVVVLMHGWEGRGSQLAAFVGPLLERGYRVVAFDAPAHGDSSGLFSDVRDFAAALRAVEAREGQLHAVVAHSMGALGFALAQREGLDVQRAVLIAPALSPARPIAWLASQLDLPGRTLTEVQEQLATFAGMTWDELATGGLYDSVTAPALAFHDEEDVIVTTDEVGDVARRVGAPVIATTGLGHNRVLRDDDVVARAVEFVDEAPAARAVERPGWDRFLEEIDVALSVQAWS